MRDAMVVLTASTRRSVPTDLCSGSLLWTAVSVARSSPVGASPTQSSTHSRPLAEAATCTARQAVVRP